MVAKEVVYDPSESASFVPPDSEPIAATLADVLMAHYMVNLDDYCEAKKEATVCQLNYWETEDKLASATVIAEARAITLITGGGGKLTEYVLKAYVKEVLERDEGLTAARVAFHEARDDREAANSALSLARERLTATKNEIALHVGARD